MKRNKIFLAMSLLIVSTTQAEATDSHTHSADHHGIWHRFFSWHDGDGPSPSGSRVWPTAEADSATTTADTSTTIDLLGNDTGTGLKIKSLYENTQFGGKTSTSGGVVTYTPAAGFSGTDEFWYVIADANGRTNAARVSIEVGGGGATAATAEVAGQAFISQEFNNQTQPVPNELGDIPNFDPETIATGNPLAGIDTIPTDTPIIVPEALETAPDVTNAAFIDTGVTQTTPSASTVGVACDYSEDAYNESVSIAANSTSEWSCDEAVRKLTANGLPDHEVGTFPSEANPNTITAQAISDDAFVIPLTPTKTDTVSMPDVIAYALNGVKIDAVTTGSCNMIGDDCSLTDNSGIWSIEATGPANDEGISQSSFDFGSDDNNGYVQADGAYRYHGMPEGFLENQGASDAVMTLIGWAADGFPIYGRHGHTDANDVESTLKVMTGSYQAVSTDDGRPSLDTYALGTFTQDWQYFAGSGDLDECNGRTGVTPEFPSGIYHYFATDSYPFMPRCVMGEAEGAVVDTFENPTVNPDVNPFEDTIQAPVLESDVNPFENTVQSPMVGPMGDLFDDKVETPAVDQAENLAENTGESPEIAPTENPFEGTLETPVVDSTEEADKVSKSWWQMFSREI